MLHSPIMPFLIFNLGTEMLYILQQRLQAQQISSQKSARVLSDVTRTMLTPEFIEALFTRQPMYSHKETRKIFDRLAHSSIMRLSKPSMDKLYDLMTMGLKYQLMQLRDACEILQLTLNHLDVVFKMVEDADVLDVVRDVIARVRELASQMTIADWKQIQEQLYSFFQDKHIKVSLFLNSGIQYQNGHYCLERLDERVLPFRGKAGEVRLYGDDGEEAIHETPEHPYAAVRHINEENLAAVNHLNTEKRTCKFGYNMYLNGSSSTQQDREKQESGTVSGSTDSTSTAPTQPTNILERLSQQAQQFQDNNTSSPMSDRFKQYAEKDGSTTTNSSAHEFNLLAHILGGVQKETKGKIANENILHISNLFGAGKDEEPILTDQELESFGIAAGGLPKSNVQSLRFGTDNSTAQDLSNLMKDFDLDSGKKGDDLDDDTAADEGQDLLDLMDMA